VNCQDRLSSKSMHTFSLINFMLSSIRHDCFYEVNFRMSFHIIQSLYMDVHVHWPNEKWYNYLHDRIHLVRLNHIANRNCWSIDFFLYILLTYYKHQFSCSIILQEKSLTSVLFLNTCIEWRPCFVRIIYCNRYLYITNEENRQDKTQEKDDQNKSISLIHRTNIDGTRVRNWIGMCARWHLLTSRQTWRTTAIDVQFVVDTSYAAATIALTSCRSTWLSGTSPIDLTRIRCQWATSCISALTCLSASNWCTLRCWTDTEWETRWTWWTCWTKWTWTQIA
jgi:hypothetical protein